MPYIITRAVPSLELSVGDELKHEQGKLPTALLFDAEWVEPKQAEAVEEKPKKSK